MSVALSVVSGHWVKDSPAKTTIPILSEGLWDMNSIAMSLAALMRSGAKSRASIEVETSIARTMSIPSVSTFSICSEERGRAMAMTIITRASVLSRKGKWRRYSITECPPARNGTEVDTLRWGVRPRISLKT